MYGLCCPTMPLWEVQFLRRASVKSTLMIVEYKCLDNQLHKTHMNKIGDNQKVICFISKQRQCTTRASYFIHT